MSLDMEVGLGRGNILLDEDQLPTERDQQPLHFLAHVYCGQTVPHLSNC